MKLLHHPDDATLASYAACAVDSNFAAVLDLHLQVCERCRARLAKAEQIGAYLLDQLIETPPSPELKERLLADIASSAVPTVDAEAEVEAEERPAPAIPAYLQQWQSTDFDHLPWKRMAPGIRQLMLPGSSGRLYLLKISPGTSLPHHGHQGSEMTMVLRGSYSDEIGRFLPGCVADLDDQVEHQPIVDRGEPCICLVATNAPLRFSNWLPRLLQPLMQL